jgi:hypothetical protein
LNKWRIGFSGDYDTGAAGKGKLTLKKHSFSSKDGVFVLV